MNAEPIAPEVFRAALELEKLKNARQLNALRFAGISLFLGLYFFLGVILRQPTFHGPGLRGHHSLQ